MPLTYLAKYNGADKFVTSSGKRFTATKVITLSLIATETRRYGSLHNITYGAFIDELNLSRGTVCRNLQELAADGIIERNGQSKYRVKIEGCDGAVKRVYHFLRDVVNFGGTVKKLSANAVIYASNLISHYLNPKTKNTMFEGGVARAAKLLNVAKSTACGVINELIDTRVIFRNKQTRDSAGNKIISEGKGTSKREITVYTVNPKVLAICRAINSGKVGNNKTASDVRTTSEAVTPKPATKREKANAVYRRLFDKLKSEEAEQSDQQAKVQHIHFTDEQKYINVDARFALDKIYIDLKYRLKDLKTKWLREIRSGERDVADGIEAEQLALEDELRQYILRHDIAADDLPTSFTKYII
jgi:hypothetical protein